MTTGPVPDQQAAPSVWNIANGLTMFRIVLVPVFGALLLADRGHSAGFRWLAAACFAVAMFTDRVDGNLARQRGLVTAFGQVADPIADKALVTMALGGLSWLGEIPWWVTVLVLAREWGITLMRLIVIRHGVLPASRGGKIKTALQTLALFLFVLPRWALPGETIITTVAWVVLWAAVVVTVVTGLDYVGRAARLRRTSARAARKRDKRAAQP
ncbi:MAG: CDP-diacylglycerol--glycerol-3-phosphate 3-phosphatidyltransferase [Nostocoides sp.]